VFSTFAGSSLLSKVGTPPYFFPERGKDKAYGALADVWALGCVLIELITLTRLRSLGGVWNASEDHEVVERRNQLLREVRDRDESMGEVVFIRTRTAVSVPSA
jgi:serine/threonine protein kinase